MADIKELWHNEEVHKVVDDVIRYTGNIKIPDEDKKSMIWGKISRYDYNIDMSNPAWKAYVRRIALSAIARTGEKEAKRRETELSTNPDRMSHAGQDVSSPSASAEMGEVSDILRSAVDKLNPREREFVKRLMGGEEQVDLAKDYGFSRGGISRAMKVVYQKLRRALVSQGYDREDAMKLLSRAELEFLPTGVPAMEDLVKDVLSGDKPIEDLILEVNDDDPGQCVIMKEFGDEPQFLRKVMSTWVSWTREYPNAELYDDGDFAIEVAKHISRTMDTKVKVVMDYGLETEDVLWSSNPYDGLS
jgi:RNA polymerase sigma factor (sigma-70 family)